MGDPTESHDLMAGFDMAHDRKDRAPEVRAYLENLRPQILELQKRFRLQTQEDIDGLDRRDDLDMNEVDKLTGLIKAFTKAWKENKVSPSEFRRVETEAGLRRARVAFEKLTAILDEAFAEKRALFTGQDRVVQAIAEAGESRLAWELSERIQFGIIDSKTQPIDHVLQLETKFKICEASFNSNSGFYPIKLPALADEFEKLAKRPPPQDESRISRIGCDGAKWMQKDGAIFSALGVASRIPDAFMRMDALFSINENDPDRRASKALEGFRDAMITEGWDWEIQLTYWLRQDGFCEAAMEIYEKYRTIDQNVLLPMAEACARLGRPERLPSVLADAQSRSFAAFLLGSAAATSLEAGYPLNAGFLLQKNEELDWGEMNMEDLATLTEGMLRIGKKEYATRLAEACVARITPGIVWFHVDALVRLAGTLADHGLDASKPIALLVAGATAAESGDADRTLCADMSLKAKVSVALRTVRREALRFNARNNPEPATFDKDAWEEAMGDVLTNRRDIADLLAYAPIRA